MRELEGDASEAEALAVIEQMDARELQAVMALVGASGVDIEGAEAVVA